MIANRNLIIIAFIAGAALASLVNWKLWHKAPVIETYAAAERQADGSALLERKPDADAKPVHKIPKGAKVERVIKLEVKPKSEPLSPEASAPDCPPVRVDLSLVKLPDETRRVIASSVNGEIVAGVDIPVEAARPVKEHKWAAGLTMSPVGRGYGAFVDRDLGPFRVGAELNQSEAYGFDFRLKAGLRF
ncbi:MAG: hypothetical protein HS130_07685 [Deltaproteobacteria bacterium]|nr:hypothetical protein [Deltaproteobacteria bacterium]MCL4873108.1 hypothetical protein [bacterium]